MLPNTRERGQQQRMSRLVSTEEEREGEGEGEESAGPQRSR